MNYEKQTFVDGDILTAEQLNRIEDALARIAVITSNPNLLDNWYWADPINQRGAITWTGWQYGIDRWMSALGNGVTWIQSEGVVHLSQGAEMYHLFEGHPFDNMTVTLSALLADNTLVSGTGNIGVQNVEKTWQECFSVQNPYTSEHHIRLRVNFEETSGNLNFTVLSPNEGNGAKVIAVKMELGSQQTLAHEENGVWVLNDPPPNKALELAKCRRYQIRLDNGTNTTHQRIGLGISQSTSAIIVNVPISTPLLLNSAGSFTLEAKDVTKWFLRNASTSVPVVTMTATVSNQNMLSLNITTASNSLVAGETYLLTNMTETSDLFLMASNNL